MSYKIYHTYPKTNRYKFRAVLEHIAPCLLAPMWDFVSCGDVSTERGRETRDADVSSVGMLGEVFYLPCWGILGCHHTHEKAPISNFILALHNINKLIRSRKQVFQLTSLSKRRLPPESLTILSIVLRVKNICVPLRCIIRAQTNQVKCFRACQSCEASWRSQYSVSVCKPFFFCFFDLQSNIHQTESFIYAPPPS